MPEKYISTDLEMEAEINRLRTSPFVKLAIEYDAAKERRRQLLFKLQDLEAKGMELSQAGITLDALDDRRFDEVYYYDPPTEC